MYMLRRIMFLMVIVAMSPGCGGGVATLAGLGVLGYGGYHYLQEGETKTACLGIQDQLDAKQISRNEARDKMNAEHCYMQGMWVSSN